MAPGSPAAFSAVLLFIQILRCKSESFYGYSYVHSPLTDSREETDITLKFNTAQSDGLLLAAGFKDRCVIELQGGRIRITLDLGSGPASLVSPPMLPFNDLRWHYIHLTRHLGSVALSIDNIYTSETRIEGGLQELNIDRGVSVGGVSSFDISADRYMGNFKQFRGCIKDVTFNSVDVFDHARRNGPEFVYGVKANCSREFAATSDQAISFVHNKSFVAFSPLQSIMQGRISFTLRTRATLGLLVYSSGRYGDQDFLAVEIVTGSIKVTVDKGSGKVHLLSTLYVSDGSPHHIEIIVQPVSLIITVDGQQTTSRTTQRENNMLNLDSLLYVGGLGVTIRSLAVEKELESLQGNNAAAGSFIGCIENFRFKSQRLGFREIIMSDGVEPDCLWNYPCMSNPCIEEAVCIEDGYRYFSCICSLDNCVKPGVSSVVQTPAARAVVHVQDLALTEGGSAVLTFSNIRLLVHPDEYDIDNSWVMFRVREPPQHGRFIIRGNQSNDVFTLQDLNTRQVVYEHDDSETTQDRVVLRLYFINVPDGASDEFKARYSITLMMVIAPWNDRPVIILPQNNTLKIVENTEILVTPAILNVVDPDDTPSNLEYTIQYPHQSVTSYFEVDQGYGRKARAEIFTHQDVIDGHVDFVHRGPETQTLKLEVSDHKDWSDFVLLNIVAVPLRLLAVVCSGIDLMPGSSRLITNDTLAFTTNAPHQQYQIKYTVSGFLYGSVEKLHNSGGWRATSVFYQRDVDQNKVRYVHNERFGDSDFSMSLKVSSMGVETHRYPYQIIVVIPTVSMETNQLLEMEGEREAVISDVLLEARSSLSYHTLEDIVFQVTSTPQYGDLLLVRPGRRRPRKEVISDNGTFSQYHLNRDMIHYRLFEARNDPVQDSFEFKVFIPEAESSLMMFRIRYTPDEGRIIVINTGLTAREGEKKKIGANELSVTQTDVNHFQFDVVRIPRHGVLQLIEPQTGDIVTLNATRFTSEDVMMNRLYYYHDDSESRFDMFGFVATPTVVNSDDVGEGTESVRDNFVINITLENDNRPTRIVDKTFDVEPNSGRILTLNDLHIEDADIDQDEMLLQFRRLRQSNADLVLASNHSSSVQEFRQRQIRSNELYVRNRGPNLYGWIDFEVTDSLFTVDFTLTVQAGHPYIQLTRNTGLSVVRGMTTVITAYNLTAVTNKDVRDDQIKFIITRLPMHGTIYRNQMNRTRFTMEDIRTKVVMYHHDGTDNGSDNFEFQYYIGRTELSHTGSVDIRVTPREGRMTVRNNNIAHIFPNASLIITRQLLSISNPGVPARNIVFTVTSPPRHGTLIIPGSEGVVHTFCQRHIDDKQLIYKNSNTGHSITMDVIGLSVSNGADFPLELDFQIELLPSVIPVVVRPFSVHREARAPLGVNVINVTNYFLREQNNLVFTVLDPPRNGYLVLRGQTAIHFNQAVLRNGEVFYIHDGSDTTSDQFTIQASFNDSTSYREAVHVTVEARRPQPPTVVKKNKLTVWTGSTTVVSRHYLLAVDNDTAAANLTYTVTPPTNGYFTLNGAEQTSFTQDDIDNERVSFVHTGAISSSISFVVSDGNNTTATDTWHISAESLSLQLQRIDTLYAFPGVKQPIHQEILHAHTNDPNQSNPIVFVLKSPPNSGKLYRNDSGVLHNITQFTQSEINAGEIIYEYTSALSGGSWRDTDNFYFDIETMYARSIEQQHFPISISYLNVNKDNRQHLIDMNATTVPEGGSINITEVNLDISPLWDKLDAAGLRNFDINYLTTSLPEHGFVQFDGVNKTQHFSFKQRDLREGLLTYTHDHSDTLWDTFFFTLEISSILSSGEREIRSTGLNQAFNITISPINDQPVNLETLYPSINLVQGANITITSRDLRATDADTPPSEIKFEIHNPPSWGRLINTDRPGRSVRSFSQEDINNNKIMYLHNFEGSLGDAFYFSYWDGHHKPIYRTFSFSIDPLVLELREEPFIFILQGHTTAQFYPRNFLIHTNGGEQNILFNITAQPLYGEIFKDMARVSRFYRKDLSLTDLEIYYIQTDLSKNMDYFQFTLSNDFITTSIQTAFIRVRPQVNQTSEPLGVPRAGRVHLTLNVLNATALAVTTRSNPVFHVMSEPRHGRIDVRDSTHLRMRREARKNRPNRRRKEDGYNLDEADMTFTHADVREGLVSFEANPLDEARPVYDNFTYVVTARDAQPVQLVFPLVIVPENFGSSAAPTEAIPKSSEAAHTKTPVVSKTGKPRGQRHIARSQLVIVGIVCAITFTVVVSLIAVKCVKVRRKRRERKQALSDLHEDTKPPIDMNQPGLTYDDLTQTKRPLNKTIPVISVTSDSDVASLESMGSRSTGRSRSSGKHSYSSHMNHHGPAPDVTHTDANKRTLPSCKVTPLPEEDGDDSGMSSKHEQITFDWENVDPELLQHCRTTNPVLHSNKYWV